MPRKKETIAAAAAHLFLASPDDWAPEAAEPETLALLSSPERERYEGFGHSLPRRLFLTGRALARSALSRYVDVAAEDWVFDAGEHGRPGIAAPAETWIDFNLAHTDRLVACLVTGGRDGGVDVESTQRTLDPVRMADHSFAPEESADLRTFEGQDRQDRFLAYWTLKEAYLKARGAGFTLRLDAAVFRFQNGGLLEARFAERARDRPEDWWFDLYRAPSDHLVAVAVRHRGAGGGEVVPIWAEPPASWRPIVLETLASNRGRGGSSG